jgi:hypothetical protein
MTNLRENYDFLVSYGYVSGLYYKNITIVNDPSRVIKNTIVSDATTSRVTYGHQLHS